MGFQSDLELAIKGLKNADLVAVDVETDGLNTRKNRIIGLGISISANQGYYFDKDVDVIALLPHLHGKKLLTWNGYFDLEMILNNYGVDLWDSLHADVQMMKHTVDERPPFGLKPTASMIFGHDSTNEQAELKASIKANGGGTHDYFMADLEILAKYCIQDCILTYKLYEHYSVKLENEDLNKFFYEDEVMPLYKEVTRFMQCKGIKIDIEKTEELNKSIIILISNLKSSILSEISPYIQEYSTSVLNKKFPAKPKGKFAQKLLQLSELPIKKTPTGKFKSGIKDLMPFKNHPYISFILCTSSLLPEESERIQYLLWEEDNPGQALFNLNSKDHLKALFFDILREIPLTETKGGKPQADKNFIESMAQKYSWCQDLIDYNKLSKIQTTYYQRFIDKSEDGVYYPSFKQFGTISGRYGSDFQQLPRVQDSKSQVANYQSSIRTLVVPKSNNVFIDADYESLEPHIFAHVSGETEIQNIFKLGHDFYSTIAIIAENLNGVSADKNADNYLGKVDKNRRQNAKAYTLGIPYGMGSFALSKNLNISQEEADRIIKGYLRGFKNLDKWMRETDALVGKHGYIKSQAGRMRHFNYEHRLYNQYGDVLLDSLELYKEYNHAPEEYAEMKKKGKMVKNMFNNAKNFQIQSLAASIVNRACININRRIVDYGAHICLQVHDQIVVDCPKQHTEQVKVIIQEVMESVYKLDVDLKAPPMIGYNLAETH